MPFEMLGPFGMPTLSLVLLENNHGWAFSHRQLKMGLAPEMMAGLVCTKL
jgi:hypothetical protein